MEITNKYRLKRPETYQNTLIKNSNFNNIGANFSLNPLHTYKNAFNNLREGLNELENLNMSGDENLNSCTYTDIPINNLLKNTQEYNTINNNSIRNRNKYILNNQEKNTISPIHLKHKYNNSFNIGTQPNNRTLGNKNVLLNKLNISQRSNKTYRSSIKDDENKQNKIITKEPKQNQIAKINTNLYQKKINDMTKNIKIYQLNNQKLIKDKNNLLNKIGLIENQLKKTKEYYDGELKNKSNNIMILKQEITKLNILLNKKKEENDDLKKKIIIFTKESEIKTLDDNLENEINNLNQNKNTTNLLNQINSLKIELQNSKTQITNKNTTIKKIKLENQKRLNEFNKKIKILNEENTRLKNNSNENIQSQMKTLINENNELKNKILLLEKSNNNNCNNINNNNQNNIKNLKEFNSMKNDLEAKKLEINNLNENIMNLTIDMNKFKNFNEVHAKDIFSLRGEIDK